MFVLMANNKFPFNELCASRLMEQSSLFQIGVSSLLLLQMAFWTLVSRLWRFRFLSFFVCYPPRVLSLLPCYFFTQPDFHSSGSRWTHSLGWWLSAKRHGRPPHTTLHIAELIVLDSICTKLVSTICGNQTIFTQHPSSDLLLPFRLSLSTIPIHTHVPVKIYNEKRHNS
jgi:hypothetical protein